MIEGSLEAKLPTYGQMEKHSQDEAPAWRKAAGRRSEAEKIRQGESPKREDADARKGRKVAKHCVYPMICGSRGSKSRLAKARVRTQLASCKMKSCTQLWREAHLEVKMHKTHHSHTTFGSCDVKKVHACGAKHIWKSKCTKHTILVPLLEVAMSKNCSPLWREAHLEVKMYKTHHSRTTFGS